MVADDHARKRKGRFWYSFPFQLLVLHLKRNHFLLLFWIVLFALATESFATKFGIPSLLLAPEYLGVVGIRSFGILGFSLGGFIMAFNIYTYINHAHRFPFLGTLSRPFFKFCINNFIIPVAFIITFIWCSSAYLKATELKTTLEIIIDMAAFLLGNVIFIALATLYFFPTNKNIFKITGLSQEEMDSRLEKRRKSRHANKLYLDYSEKYKWRVDTYLVHPFKIGLARESRHYDKQTLEKVFYQNHVNASLFESIIVLVFFFIGAFQYNDIFIIPAAASGCLVFTVVLMAISILMSWLKGWTLSVLVLLFLIINAASSHYDLLNQSNFAYGLNYDNDPVDYNLKTIDSLNNDLARVRRDIDHHVRILESKFDTENRMVRGLEKPKMILINTSGGGLRSTLWTVRVMQYVDSLIGGTLLNKTALITGSSGGIIGASYYRELKLREDSLEHSIYSKVYRDKASTDILNRILFTFATNDIFIRFRRAQIDGKTYILDRGKTFENQLNRNTDFILEKRVSDYYKPVSSGDIPPVVMAPSVVNDGRRLLISSQPISFLAYEFPDLKEKLNLLNEDVEFARLFSGHEAQNLKYTSALRMNSTFPYILPYAGLPTDPKIEVMDAGLRDNLGTKITAQYLYALREWIEENCSGVIIIQIRDTQKFSEPRSENSTILNRLLNPIGSFYGNYFNDQDYNMDQLTKSTEAWLDIPLHRVTLELQYEREEKIALSWHLAAIEKKKINSSIDKPHNQKAIEKLMRLLEAGH